VEVDHRPSAGPWDRGEVTLTTAALTLLGLAAALALGFGGLMFRSMYLPTRGRQIGRRASPRRALLVLDLQEGYAPTARRQPVTSLPSTGLFGAVNRLVAWGQASGVEVGYVTQHFDAGWLVRLHGGRRAGPMVVDRRVLQLGGPVFQKRRTDAFASRPLEAWLEAHGVDEVILAGVDAAYCVTMTARGALQRGYRVTVVEDAVASRHPLPPVLAKLTRRGVKVVGSGALTGLTAG
jgi:nicotinamidase-related amidase